MKFVDKAKNIFSEGKITKYKLCRIRPGEGNVIFSGRYLFNVIL